MPKLDNPGAAGGATHAGLPDVSANQHHVSFVQADHDALANPHHAAAHTLTSHSTRAHSELTGIGATDHHSNANDHAQLHHAAHEPAGGDAMAVDAAAATGSLRTLGTGATNAAAGNDSRLSDARTPTAHEASHELGGTDPVPTPLAPITTVTIPSGHCAVVAGRYYVTAAVKLVIADTARFAIV